jgi:predicted Zn-dependent protease
MQRSGIPRARSIAALVLALLLIVPPNLGTAVAQVRLPDLGGRVEVLPPDEARIFPNEFRNFMRAQGLLIEDPLITAYFDEMGYRLVMHSDGRDRPFHFHVLRIPGINAFAAPAGVVALNSGLILAAASADEVAGVLAHEVSHVTQNHLVRGLEEAQRVSLPMMLATLGLVLAGGAAGGLDADAAQGLLMTGLGLSQQSQINYTRQNESEADRIGIQLMARAGYDPSGMVDFFDTLNRWSRSMGAGPPEYLRTHPMTVSRIAEARDRAEQLPGSLGPADDVFHFIQARLRVLMSQHSDAAADWFQRNLNAGSAHPDAARYGLALALLRGSQLDRAESALEELRRNRGNDQLFRLLEGELRLAQGRVDKALAIHERLFHDYGQSRPIAIAYAEALLHENDPDRAALASTLLRDQLRRAPDDLKLTELLAMAADRAGDPVRAAEAVATNYYYRGGLPQAIDQLERVLQRDDLSYYDRARIAARLDQLRVERMRSNRRPDDGQ